MCTFRNRRIENIFYRFSFPGKCGLINVGPDLKPFSNVYAKQNRVKLWSETGYGILGGSEIKLGSENDIFWSLIG